VPWYVDASAFVKLVSEEDRSDELRAWVAEKERIETLVSSDLLRTEAVRAIRRSAPENLIAIHERLSRIVLLSMSAEVFRRAGDLDPITLRSLDALHLAAALSLGDDLSGVVTYDIRMAEAAHSLGIPTAAP
jgi:uncharacterized protein